MSTGYAMFVEGWNAAIMWLLRHDSPTLRMAGDTMMRDASTQESWLRLLRGNRVHGEVRGSPPEFGDAITKLTES